VLAQRVVEEEAPPGWIGIAYEVSNEETGRAEDARVWVTNVSRGSPADAAGIRVGDRLVAIDGIRGAAELKNLPARLRLRAGQEVRLSLEREGRSLDLTLRATERPIGRADVRVRTDSMVEAMFQAMDSLRLRLARASGADAGREAVGAARAGRFQTVTGGSREKVGAPFEFFVFRGERYDSLVREMEELDRQFEHLRRVESERSGEEARTSRRSPEDAADRSLAEVHEAFGALARESARLRAAMSEAARQSAGVQYLLENADAVELQVGPVPRIDTFRPLTPYLLGSSRVAGAHVVDLRPELGSYFGVESGVLVVDVPAGTPAALAGLLPGDVVTRLDRAGVRTVEELRFGVAQAGDSLPLTLVRRGTSLQVLLRRR
jgi:predicted metalloprotease with PDZ domain